MRLFLPLLLLTACQRPEPNYIDAQIQPYVEKFASKYGQIMPKIQVYFGNIQPRAGQCSIKRDRFKQIISREIIIDNYHWAQDAWVLRKATVWHELGHCVLMRGHEPGGSLSYMAEYFGQPSEIDDLEFIGANEIILDNELFK